MRKRADWKKRIKEFVIPTSLKILCAVVPLAAAGYLWFVYELVTVFGSRALLQEEERIGYVAELLAEEVTAEEFAAHGEDTAYFERRAEELLAPYGTEHEIAGIEGAAPVETGGEALHGHFFELREGNWVLLEAQNMEAGEDEAERRAKTSGENHSVPQEQPQEQLPEAERPEAGAGAKTIIEAADTAALQQAAETGETVTVRLQGSESKARGKLSAYTAVFDGNGTAVGAVQVKLDTDGVIAGLVRQLTGVGTALLLFLVVLLFAVAVITVLSLSPLWTMVRGIRRMTAGEQGIRLKVRGSQEVADILLMFNHAQEQLNRYLKKISGLRAAYGTFVQERGLRLLGRPDVRSVEPGDAARFDAGVLQIRAEAGKNGEPEADCAALFSELSDAAEENGGFVGAFEQNGGRAFFENSEAAAISAAVRVLRGLSGSGLRCHAGVSFGNLRLYVAGTEQRMALAAQSDCILLNERLCRLAAQYGAEILAAAPKEAAFRARKLGLLEQENGAPLPVFEIYEADEKLQRQRKDETKDMFEQGVSLYTAGRFREARDCFAAVLRKNRSDMAASIYFTRCDAGTEQEKKQAAGSNSWNEASICLYLTETN